MKERCLPPKTQNLNWLVALLLVFGSAAGLVGCQKKTDATSELKSAVKVLEQPGSVQPATAQPGQNGTAVPPVAQQVDQAINSFKAGNYSDAIGLMEKAGTNPTRTPGQTIAVQDAMAAVMRDLYARAARGDAAAQQAIKQYKDNRNRH